MVDALPVWWSALPAIDAAVRWSAAPGVLGLLTACAFAVAAAAMAGFALLRRRRRREAPTLDLMIEATMRDGTIRRRHARMDVETLPELAERLRGDMAIVSATVFQRIHRHGKTFADALTPETLAAAGETLAVEAAGLTPGGASPDDLRRAGWTLAMHRDVALDGAKRVVWILERDGRSVSGEAATDVQALDAARRAAAGTPSGMAAAVAEPEASR